MKLESIPLDTLAQQGYKPYGLPELADTPPTFTETAEAAFAANNWIYSAFTGGGEPFPAASDIERMSWAAGEFDQYKYLEQVAPHHATDDKVSHFTDLMSPAQVEWKVRRLDREEAAYRTLSKAPWWQSVPLGMAAELLSPVELLASVGTLPRTASALAKSLGLRNIGAVSAHEALIHQQQETRDIETSLAYVAGAGAFGSAVGGVLGGVMGRRAAPLPGDPPPGHVPNTAMQDAIEQGAEIGGSGGAARVDYGEEPMAEISAIGADPNLTKVEKAKLIQDARGAMYAPTDEGLVRGAGLGTHKLIPEVRMLMSPFTTVKRFANTIFNHPMMNRLRAEQRALPNVETAFTRRIEQNNAVIPDVMKKSYADYKRGAPKPDRMDMAEFEYQVQLAMTRGDASDIPAVTKAAAELRKLIEPYTERLAKQELLDPNQAPLGDQTWFVRSWNPEWFRRHTQEEVEAALMPGLRKHAEAELAEAERALRETVDADVAAARADGDEKQALTMLEEGDKEIAKIRPEWEKQQKSHLRSMRNELGLGVPLPGESFVAPGVRRIEGGTEIIKHRTIPISTSDVPRETLNSNVSGSLSRTLDRMEKLLAVTEDARLGDPSFSNIRRELSDEYNTRLAYAKVKGDDTAQLSKDYEKAVAELDNTAMALYGTVPAQDPIRNFTTGLKAYNAITDLGRVIFSVPGEAFAAAGGPIGFSGILRHALLNVSNRAEMKAMKKSLREHFAFGMETAAGSRLSDLGDYDAGLRGPTRVIQKVADFAVDKAFGLGIWTRQARLETATALTSYLGELAKKPKLTKQQITDLGRMGVHRDLWPAIKKQVKKHGEDLGVNAVNPRLELWDDAELADTVATAIHSETYNTILKPGLGTRPWATYDPMVSLLAQYRSFTLAATSKYWLAGAQRMASGDPRPLMQFALMSSTAALATRLRQTTYAEERRREFTMQDYIREGVTMGAFFGVLSDLNALSGAITSGHWDAFRMVGMDPQVMTKYQGTRTVAGAIGGASYGTITDVTKAMGAIARGLAGEEITQGDIGAIRRVIPFNNYAPISHSASEAEAWMFKEVGGQ